MIDDKPDYADLWIHLQSETRMMHNYLLQSRWSEAGYCAIRCEKISIMLMNWCEKMETFERSAA